MSFIFYLYGLNVMSVKSLRQSHGNTAFIFVIIT